MNQLRLTLLMAAGAVLAPAAFAANAACNTWTQVSSPNLGTNDNVLAAVAANSATDIWAVGQIIPVSDPNITNTLIQHYDGTAWSVVASANVGKKANALLSVTATGGLAWASGYYIDNGHQSRGLIEAWDGSAWKIVGHPHTGIADYLFGISAISPSDIWAVGAYVDTAGIFQTLIEHFDGAVWSIVPSPSPGSTGNQLYGVHAIDSKNVWAVGQMFGTDGPDQGLIEHWDGTQWSVVPSAAYGDHSILLYGVTATAGGNVVAAGDAQNNLQNPLTLIEGTVNGKWALQKPVNAGTGENHLYGIAALTPDSMWAVGTYAATTGAGLSTLIERHTSSGWVQETTPSPGLQYGNSEVAGIAIVSSTDVWAVGTYDGPNAPQTLILHRCQ